jgi:hypothetical protein
MSTDWGTIIAIIIAVSAAILSWRKAPNERRALDGDGAMKFEQAAASIAARNIELMKRIEALERSVQELETSLAAEQERSRKFENWAQRLVYQIKMMGAGEPVPYEQYPTQPDTARKP